MSSTEKAAGKSIWPKMPPAFVRAMLAGHSALGLAFAALIYVVCFSGAVAVFTEEFHQWENPAAPRIVSVSNEAIDKAFDAVLKEGPWAHGGYIHLPKNDDKTFRITIMPDFGDKAHKTLTYYADAEGNLIKKASNAWTEFQAVLHIRLHLPQMWGGFVVGLTGVALLSTLVSGVLSHPRVFKDAFRLRLGSNKRLQEVDIHNRIGVWAMPFHVIVSLTGAFLGLTTIVVGILALAVFKGDVNKAYELFLGPHPIDDPRPAPRPDLKGILLDFNVREPDAVPTLIMFEHPGEEGGAVAISAQTKNYLSRGEMHAYDRKGGYLGYSGWEKGTLGQKIYAAMAPLHLGWFGGWPVKIVYAVLGFGLAAVTSSGVAIWLARRRDKGRPAPTWEKLWIATVWGQPVAYVSVAMAALLTRNESWLLPMWGGVTLLVLVASIWVPVVAMSRSLRAVTAAGLVALVSVHGVMALKAGSQSPVVWGVDVGCLLIAGLLIASLFYTNRSPSIDNRTLSPE